MLGLFDLPGKIAVRRRVYAALLAAGMTGLITWLLADVGVTLARSEVPAFSAAEPGAPLKALTAGSHMDGFSAWSPDGQQIAFMRDGRIWLMSAAGQGARPLTRPDGAWDAAPAWQPDGKRIAFIRLFPQQDNKAQVLAIDPATGSETKLAEEGEPIGYLAWAPKENNLLYTTSQRIMRVDVGGKKSHQVLKVGGDWELMAGGLAISPDGRWAIFGAGPRVDQSVVYDLWRLAIGGKAEPERLTHGGGIMPAFDPAGRRVAYRNPREATGLYLLTLANHANRRILADAGKRMYFHPAFAPDGKHLSISQLTLENGAEGREGSRFISNLYLLALSVEP